jgi:hypothetical protein
MRPIWRASYSRGMRLAKAGCALPYLERLPERTHYYQRPLYVEEIGGYAESFAIDEGASTVYGLALRIGTERRDGAIVTDFRFISPWEDHVISWGYDPEDVVPDSRLASYRNLVKSRLSAVLFERKLLRRGRPVEGLLCGRASTPIPLSALRERPAMAEIILVGDSCECVRSRIHLQIDRSRAQKGRTRDRALAGEPKTTRDAR